MHIVQVFCGQIPPSGYGGIERVVYWLIRELLQQGHHITLIADAASRVAEEYPEIRFFPYEDIECLPEDALSSVDIVHFHNEVEASWAAEMPYIVTEHGNSKKKIHYDRNTVFLSQSHARNHNAKYFLPNGIPVQDYPFSDQKNKNLLYMAKLNWRTKNAKTAINLAFDTGIPVCLTGGRLKQSRKVWGQWLLRYPFKGNLIEEYGVVDGEVKLDLLTSAMCLFYLVNWHEPFALAPHEALACGTPVLATPNGALQEYIEHGKNGFIVSDYSQAVQVIQSLKAMSAQQTSELAHRCRESAYTIQDSVKKHTQMYEKVINERYLYSEQDAQQIRFTNPPARSISK